jgi:hypothetical protein
MAKNSKAPLDWGKLVFVDDTINENNIKLPIIPMNHAFANENVNAKYK